MSKVFCFVAFSQELHVEVSDTYFPIQIMVNMFQALLLNPEVVLDKSSSVGNIHVCHLFCFIMFIDHVFLFLCAEVYS